jgi:hypothetical protein
MRFLAFCLAVSALAATSVAVISALQTSTGEPAKEEPRTASLPANRPVQRLIDGRPVYPLRFSLN